MSRIATLRTLGPLVPPSDGRIARPEPKRADPFYQSREWRELLARIVAARGRRCEDPAHDPRYPRDGIRIFGDHVRELRDGGAPLDVANILLRCGACHARKTVDERAERARTTSDGKGVSRPAAACV